MRQADENSVWERLKKSRAGKESDLFRHGKVALDLKEPCIVLAGRNGTGKSRLIRSLAANATGKRILIDIHFLCEKALDILRSRDDFSEMKEEYPRYGPDEERRKDVERVIGRTYQSIDWFSLDIEPSDEKIKNRFRWLDPDQSFIPYFEANYRGVAYTAKDMGLGEFSVHFLFWIIEQYREESDVVLVLDEPDAFLPPDASTTLLSRLQNICLRKKWSMVVVTHSTDVILRAREALALTVLEVNEEGEIIGTHVSDDFSVADSLLSQPIVRLEFFVEDESAFYLAQALFKQLGDQVANSVSIVWGGGKGYMVGLQKTLPKPPKPKIRHAFIFDGDQRDEVKDPEISGDYWPALFLPTEDDPDTLFQTVAEDSSTLATRLGTTTENLRRNLASLEGTDAHDWVNGMGSKYGRQRFLMAVSELWVERNPADSSKFITYLQETLD